MTHETKSAAMFQRTTTYNVTRYEDENTALTNGAAVLSSFTTLPEAREFVRQRLGGLDQSWTDQDYDGDGLTIAEGWTDLRGPGRGGYCIHFPARDVAVTRPWWKQVEA